MKKIILFVALLCSISTAHAQFGDLLNKVKDKLNEIPVAKPVQTQIQPATSQVDQAQGVDNALPTTRSVATKKAAEPMAAGPALPGKMYFSDKPFTSGTDLAHAKDSFVAGQEIYGMVVLDQVFGEYADDENQPLHANFIARLQSLVRPGESDVTLVETLLHASYKKQNYLLFDVAPAPNMARTRSEYPAMRLGAMLAKFERSSTDKDLPKIGNARTYKVDFLSGYPRKILATAMLNVDYTLATKDTLRAWRDKENQAAESANINSAKMDDAVSSATAAGLPLPKSFTEPSGNAYSDARFGKATILALIRRTPEVKEVMQFMFATTTASTDFVLYKTPLGVPNYQWGNRFFQFIFKDAGGTCLAAGGRLKLIYEGGGRYGAPIMLWETPVIKSSENYQESTALKAYVVDCAKVKRNV